METFFNGITPLGGGAEWKSGSNTFINSVDYLHVAHKKHRAHVHPNPPADFHRQLAISIYRHSVPHLQAWGHWICTIKNSPDQGTHHLYTAGLN